jgi:hypothetical protein
MRLYGVLEQATEEKLVAKVEAESRQRGDHAQAGHAHDSGGKTAPLPTEALIKPIDLGYRR